MNIDESEQLLIITQEDHNAIRLKTTTEHRNGTVIGEKNVISYIYSMKLKAAHHYSKRHSTLFLYKTTFANNAICHIYIGLLRWKQIAAYLLEKTKPVICLYGHCCNTKMDNILYPLGN